MKISLILPIVIGSAILMPALFADTSGTGTSTNTGTTSTGTSSTGTTNTGTTSTGSTSTGSTSTGSTSTGGVRCGSGNAISNMVAQEAYLAEMMRLTTERKALYVAAQSLTGTAKKEAIKAANMKFRDGQKAAMKKLVAVKLENKIDRKQCKKSNDDNKPRHSGDDDGDKYDDNDNNRQNRGGDDNSGKKIEKQVKKMIKKSNGHSNDD